MRGAYTAAYLDTLARRFATTRKGPVDVGRAFDLIVGTSTGGIIACALAAGVSTAEIARFYSEHGSAIFMDPVPKGLMRFLAWCIRNFRSSANRIEPLRDALTAVFGDQTLGGVLRDRQIALAIPTVDLRTQKGRVFLTTLDEARQRDDDYRLVDVCLATAAAPIYLPPVVVQDQDDPIHNHVFVDGGLWANNPVLVGLIEAMRVAGPSQPVEILSLGTCAPPTGQAIQGLKRRTGLGYWRAGARALELALDAQSFCYDKMASLVADHLDRPCKVIRPSNSPLSAEQARLVGLDRADKGALDVLWTMAAHDADQLYGLALSATPPPDAAHVAEVFASMPIAKGLGE